MVDEMFDRDYQSGRAELNDGIDRGVAKFTAGIRAAFETMHRIQWSAPWAPRTRPARARRRGLA
jgi:hypothetical protein